VLVHHIVGVRHVPKYPHEPFPHVLMLLFICIVGCYSRCMFITCVLVRYYLHCHHLASGELVVLHIVIHLSVPSTHHHHLPPMVLTNDYSRYVNAGCLAFLLMNLYGLASSLAFFLCSCHYPIQLCFSFCPRSLEILLMLLFYYPKHVAFPPWFSFSSSKFFFILHYNLKIFLKHISEQPLQH